MEKSFTDNETVKALESPCMQLERAFFILRHGSAEGIHKYFEAILVIENEFNRQKAEIEGLKDFNENLQTANTSLSNEILDIKSEAVKEFAEELRSKARKYTEYDEGGWGRDVYAVEVAEIDKVLKERAS